MSATGLAVDWDKADKNAYLEVLHMVNTFHMQVLIIGEDEKDVRPLGLHKACEYK